MSNKQYMVDTETIEQYIKDSGKKKGYLAERIGCSRQYFTAKLNNRADFTVREVGVLCDELNITDPQKKEKIFFVVKLK